MSRETHGMAERQMTFLLANVERQLLRRIAARLPRQIRPNHLSGIGVIGAVGAGVAYAMTALNGGWFWIASAMLALNWFGDSLDGTLARVRHIERPKYGYYLDHIVDAFNTAVVGIGIGLSPFVHFELALGLVVVYLVLSINVYLESNVFGVFKMAYGRIGPTEGRILLVVANTLLALLYGAGGVPTPRALLGTNVIVTAIGVVLVFLLTGRFVRNLQRLTQLEPQR